MLGDPGHPAAARDPRAARRKAFGRFLVAHMAAYVPAFVWAVAWIPIAVMRHLEVLQHLEGEKVVGSFILHQLIWPAAGTAILLHLLSVPWIRKPTRTALWFWLVAGLVLTVAGTIVAVVMWLRLLRS